MKFAKDLDENAVPEWKDKYLNYKGGKKKLKAVARALRDVDRSTEKDEGRSSPFASLRDAPVYSFLRGERRTPQTQQPNQPTSHSGSADSNTPLFHVRSRSEADVRRGDNAADSPGTQPRNIAHERSPLQSKQSDARYVRYGSILASPPDESTMESLRRPPTLELPDPALPDNNNNEPDLDYDRPISPGSPEIAVIKQIREPPPTQLAHTGNAYEASKPVDSAKPPSALSSKQFKARFQPTRHASTPDGSNKPFMRRMFSIATPQQMARNDDVALESYREVDFRQAEFFLFLDKELKKIESFYKQKEGEATARLAVLREQLHIMRDRRYEEVLAAEHAKHPSEQVSNGNNGAQASIARPDKTEDQNEGPPESRRSMAHPFAASVDFANNAASNAMSRVRTGHVGKTSQAMGQLGTPRSPFSIQDRDPAHRDYSRRDNHHQGVPYRTAKRKLKIALAEFYRALELLKSYSLLNRVAFRKINKKFDKTVNAHPTGRYMSENVNKAYFVNSEILDGHITAVEDLYARYFERGNHKIAIGKLRAKSSKAGAYTGAVFRTGLLAAAGLLLSLQGVVFAGIRLEDRNQSLRHHVETSYLMQIYAGYFLALLLSGLFVVDAGVLSMFRVNYHFIFEFDPRHSLDWKQLAEIPSWFFFLFGLFMWINFSSFGEGTMYIYWPVILVTLSAVLLMFPPPLFYPRSREWFLYSNYRLLLAGVYPVEFRDFFLGDMFCSLTYALGNVELFFCLYAHGWQNPPQCNSSNSRLLGFFSCLPGIWRLLQCFRRYHDTRDWFPHLVNGGKYSFTILQYMSLSLWRLDKKNYGLCAFFIAAAAINSFYCSVWDIMMDWSMPLDPWSKPPLLRHVLAYRKHKWLYYVAMFVDPILRFNWIFYVIYKDETQHSSLISFFIALSEIFRRALWVLIRVENEHCTNVGRFRASRDPALPYPTEDRSLDGQSEHATEAEGAARLPSAGNVLHPDETTVHGEMERRPSTTTTSLDVERVSPSAAESLRRRKGGVTFAAESPLSRALKRVGSTMITAHSQDYERKRRPVDEAPKDEEEDTDDDGSSNDER